MTDTPPVPSPAPPLPTPRSASSAITVRTVPPVTSFDTGIPGVPIITPEGVPVPPGLIEEVRNVAAGNEVTITEG